MRNPSFHGLPASISALAAHEHLSDARGAAGRNRCAAPSARRVPEEGAAPANYACGPAAVVGHLKAVVGVAAGAVLCPATHHR